MTLPIAVLLVYDIFGMVCMLWAGMTMALTRKNLMVDADQVAALAARRGTSESSAVREAVEAALFAEEFGAAMEALRATDYGAATQSEGDDSFVADPPENDGHRAPSP